MITGNDIHYFFKESNGQLSGKLTNLFRVLGGHFWYSGMVWLKVRKYLLIEKISKPLD